MGEQVAVPDHLHWSLLPGAKPGHDDRCYFTCDVCEVTETFTGTYDACNQWAAERFEEHEHSAMDQPPPAAEDVS